MTGDDLNHYVPRVPLDEALIVGGEVTALCGERLTPEIRVGSSGRADDPEMEICPACQEIFDLEELLSKPAKEPICA